MSNLGFHTVYDRVSRFHGVRCVRIFYEKGTGIFSPELNDPLKKGIFLSEKVNLREFDALFISISYEIDYLNLVKMFYESGLSPLARDRKDDDPLVIIGGIVPSSNPEIAGAFGDAVYIGELPQYGFDILELIFRHRFKKTQLIYTELQQLKGVYVQEFSAEDPVKKSEPEINETITSPAHSVIVTPDTHFSNMFLVEIARGCKNTCIFCLARYMAKRYREVPSNVIINLLEFIPGRVKKIGFIAPLVSDHSEIFYMVELINRRGFKVSFSSLRADAFTEDFAKLLRENNQKTITFAPETGNDTLRRMIGKALSNDSIFNSVEIAFKNNIKKVRLYFMYGLPDEKQEDIDSIISMAVEISRMAGRYSGSVFLSINQFMPKKLTPLGGAKLNPIGYYENVQSYLEERLKRCKNLNFKFEPMRGFPIQYFLSTGDRTHADILVRSVRSGSYRIFKELYREKFG